MSMTFVFFWIHCCELEDKVLRLRHSYKNRPNPLTQPSNQPCARVCAIPDSFLKALAADFAFD
jgi:hypothetical protein